MTTKQRVIMHRIRAIGKGVTFQEAFTDPGHPRVLTMLFDDWDDIGSPETVTVTIEPGDLLNDDPISR